MDRRHLVHLAVCRSQRLLRLALALFWYATGPSQRHVRLYLAFFRQFHRPKLASHRASRHNGRWQLHRLLGRLVDLATV